MTHCKDCKYWEQKTNSEAPDTCGRIKTVWSEDAAPTNEPYVSADSGASFVTPPNFGCVLGEDKRPSALYHQKEGRGFRIPHGDMRAWPRERIPGSIIGHAYNPATKLIEPILEPETDA